MKSRLPPFDRYQHYLDSVQSPKEDMQFLEQICRETRGSSYHPKVMREDFCGTFANCCEWVKLGKDRKAVGLDLDPEPIAWGTTNHLAALSPEQQKRVKIQLKDVTSKGVAKADVICAMNFSYYIFKQRSLLLNYFKNCRASLNKNGVFAIDCFGGSACQAPGEEKSTFGDPPFAYYWDQETFDPVSHDAMYKIHFKRKGEQKRIDCFAYDWRMWTIPELREIMLDAGFKQALVYWEGTTEEGTGDGNYKVVERGEWCDGWVAYIVGLK